jgi:hypothetical protein
MCRKASQDRQCTCNVTSRRIDESNKYYIFLCILLCDRAYGRVGACLRMCSHTYLACNARAPYYLRPLWLHHVFVHYLIKARLSRRKVTELKMCFDFLCDFYLKTFLILWRIQRDIVISVETSSCKYPLILSGLNES